MPWHCHNWANMLRLVLATHFWEDKGVFGSRDYFLVPVTSDVWTLIWSTKYILIIKLITQMETNLRDESIKPN